MSRKHSTSAARKRLKPAVRWGLYLLAGALLLAVLGAAGATDRMLLATSASPEPSAAAAPSSVRTLYAHGDRLRPLVEETGGAQTLNIYGPGGQIIAQVARDGSGTQVARHLLADHLGSTRVALDSDGNAVAHFEYGPYGEAVGAAAEVRFRYTGHPYDEQQGLYETPARGYDPTTGRFLSVDPQRQDASPYVYAGNNPVLYKDPNGKGRVGTVITPQVKAKGKELVDETSQYDSTTRFYSRIEDPEIYTFFNRFQSLSYLDRNLFDEFAHKISRQQDVGFLEAAFRDLVSRARHLPAMNAEQRSTISSRMEEFRDLVGRYRHFKANRAKVLRGEFNGNKDKFYRSDRSWDVAKYTPEPFDGAPKGFGNCGHIAGCIAGTIANADAEVNVEVFRAGEGFDHAFVVIGRNPTTDASKPMSWNPEAHIVDGWHGFVEQANKVYSDGSYSKAFNIGNTPELLMAFE